MGLANYIFKKKAKKLAGKVINGEEAIDEAVDRLFVRLAKSLSNWFVSINWGRLMSMLAKKVIGWLK